jgi:putative ABC transport system permease protein
MRRIALHSLLFDRGKLAAAVLGVALATTLAFVQIGLYRGFEVSSSTVIEHHGGDLWAMPTGLEVLDNAETLSVSVRNLLSSHPCVSDVRALIYGFVMIRKPNGTRDNALVVGAEPRLGRGMPWAVVQGDAGDLAHPLRVSVDRTDLKKLQLADPPIGATFEVNNQRVTVAAVTQGIRSFTLMPYLFTSITNARRLMGLVEGHAHFYAVNLQRAECAADVRRWMAQQADVTMITRADWMKRTERYWVSGSGAGMVLAFTAILGLIVGAVIVGQTLYSMTKEHLLELATLKALGATPRELAGFVLWQVSLLAIVGGGIGLGIAYVLRDVMARSGLNVTLEAGTVGLGVLATIMMCAVASVASLRTVLKVEAATVLR